MVKKEKCVDIGESPKREKMLDGTRLYLDKKLLESVGICTDTNVKIIYDVENQIVTISSLIVGDI